jgi:hypothetical protein
LHEAGIRDRKIAIVTGDDVLPLLQGDLRADPPAEWLRNLDTGQSINPTADRVITMSAYLGAKPIADALDRGADLVITGRVADPSLTVAPCMHHFGWAWDDWNRLAGATVAGHLTECGTQVTGGLSTDWLDVPDVATIGFPIAEVSADGSCVITKPRGTGGRVSVQSVKEQLIYEIGDPGRYLSPDVAVSFLSLSVTDEGPDRVMVANAHGTAAPPMLKVSATYRDGFRAAGTLTVVGRDAARKAQRAAESVFQGLARRGVTLAEHVIECLGTGACRPSGLAPQRCDDLTETVLRIAVADPSRHSVETFTRSLTPLITSGPPGTTGYAEGRPRVHPLIRYWPCLIARERVVLQIELLTTDDTSSDRAASCPSSLPTRAEVIPVEAASTVTLRDADSKSTIPSQRRLRDLALARSGDKGINANIGVIAREPADYVVLLAEVTSDRVAEFFGLTPDRVERFELPNLAAINIVLRGILENSLRTDAQGKSLGQQLLEMPLA